MNIVWVCLIRHYILILFFTFPIKNVPIHLEGIRIAEIPFSFRKLFNNSVVEINRTIIAGFPEKRKKMKIPTTITTETKILNIKYFTNIEHRMPIGDFDQ